MNLLAAALMLTSVPRESKTLSHVELSTLAWRVMSAAVHEDGMSMAIKVFASMSAALERDAPFAMVTVCVVNLTPAGIVG